MPHNMCFTPFFFFFPHYIYEGYKLRNKSIYTRTTKIVPLFITGRLDERELIRFCLSPYALFLEKTTQDPNKSDTVAIKIEKTLIAYKNVPPRPT